MTAAATQSAHAVRDCLRDNIADFVVAYRLAEGDPSQMMAAVLDAFEGADRTDYACGLVLANGRDREVRRP